MRMKFMCLCGKCSRRTGNASMPFLRFIKCETSCFSSSMESADNGIGIGRLDDFLFVVGALFLFLHL